MPNELLIVLRRHLDLRQLDGALSQAQEILDRASARADVIVDVTEMTGYDADARDRFVSWHRDSKDRIRGVAIVGAKPLWRMVILAMSLASSVPMRPFPGLDAARAWFRGRA